MLVEMQEPGVYRLLGQTIDDAAGEAFDKVARYLGLGYPGGPAIERIALEGDPAAIRFPRAMRGEGLDFSFSGLKTSVMNYVRKHPDVDTADLSASFQEAVVDVLVRQSLAVAEAEGLRTVLVTGGVACNARLRERMSAAAAERGIAAVFPSPAYCSDNAAMIAGLGTELLRAGELATLHADASPR
jgi:N6-L-threonylcarbamoyladenine synthase